MDDEELWDRWSQLEYCLISLGKIEEPKKQIKGTPPPIIQSAPSKQIIAKGNKSLIRKKR